MKTGVVALLHVLFNHPNRNNIIILIKYWQLWTHTKYGAFTMLYGGFIKQIERTQQLTAGVDRVPDIKRVKHIVTLENHIDSSGVPAMAVPEQALLRVVVTELQKLGNYKFFKNCAVDCPICENFPRRITRQIR